MNAILGFLDAAFVNWWAFGGLITIGLISERGGNQWCSVFFGVLLTIVSTFLFKLYEYPIQSIALLVAVYFVVGIIWSFWRYKRYVTNAVLEFESNTAYRQSVSQSNFIERLSPSEHWDAITGWVIVWPFSFVEYGVSDTIDAVKAVVSKYFKSIYQRIYQNAIAGIVPEKQEEK